MFRGVVVDEVDDGSVLEDAMPQKGCHQHGDELDCRDRVRGVGLQDLGRRIIKVGGEVRVGAGGWIEQYAS